jgi:hypothetical protein
MKYAIIENGVVTNIALADAPLADNWVASEEAGPGWTYENGVFTAPVAPTPAPVRVLTKLQYMNRFTDVELAGIYTAAKTVVSVEVWLEKFKLASEINLDDPATISGLQAMEAGGLIGMGRAAEILGATL